MQTAFMLCAAFFGASVVHTAAWAQEPQPLHVTQPDASSLRLHFENPTRQASRLQVLDLAANRLLLNETHREPAYATRLKFDQLPAGRYRVLLRVGRARYRYTVQLQARPEGQVLTVLERTTHRVETLVAALGQ